MDRKTATLAIPDRGARMAGLLVVLAVAALGVACGDATGPGPDPGPPDPPRVVSIALPDSVHLDAVRDSVRLAAELVYDDGNRAVLEGGHWTGDGGATATLHADGWVWTRGEGSFQATVSHDGFSASTIVVVRRKGRILLTFDDGWRSTRTVALPVLAAAGLTASVAVVVDAVGWSAYLSRSDLQTLHDAGWAFVSHSVSHADLTTLSSAALEWELAESRAWLRDEGLRMGDAFVVPYHNWGPREREAVARHYRAARGATVAQEWPPFVAEWRPEDPYSITTLDASTMLRMPEGRAELMGYVREAITHGLLLDLMFHDVPPEDLDAFHTLVADLATVRDRVFTWSELYPVPD
jgi:hypothetical protein